MPAEKRKKEEEESEEEEDSGEEDGSTEEGSSEEGSGDDQDGSGSGSGSEDDDDDGSSGSDSGSSEGEEEEPKLKYQRLGASVAEILKERAATCMAVAGKFLVLGTDWGNLHVLDSVSGTECQQFAAHEGRINQLAIDKFDPHNTSQKKGKKISRNKKQE